MQNFKKSAMRQDIPFSLELDETGDLAMLYDADAINQSIYTILVTSFGDRAMEYGFGTNIESLIGEPSYPQSILSHRIRVDLSEGLKRLEPLVKLRSLDIDYSEISFNKINIVAVYELGDGITQGIFQETLSTEEIKK